MAFERIIIAVAFVKGNRLLGSQHIAVRLGRLCQFIRHAAGPAKFLELAPRLGPARRGI